ncbi:MAG: asparagine--tRNA ligase, partial [Clostridia bacterium]|nr:asparagine--tRNA ligase [Clostridia bacterium]
MKQLEIRELYEQAQGLDQQEIQVVGWVRTNRDSNRFGFIELNDGTAFRSVQIVYEEGTLSNFEEVTKASISSALQVTGTLVMTPQAKQPFEIKASEVVFLAGSDSDYPLQKKRHSMEFLREIAHLRPRSNTFSAVFRVRSMLSFAIHQYFQENGFVYVHTPIITGSDCEGAGEMFRVTTLDPIHPPLCEDGRVDYNQDFFGKETSLTVSGQLEGEAFALAFRKIYTFGPTFRAENSNTARHASEFWMIEPEVAFA